MKELELAKEKALSLYGNSKWVKWVHEGALEANTSIEKTINITLAVLSLWKHCPICFNLHGCCFPKNNMPNFPLHPRCHCITVEIGGIYAQALCGIEKFEKYVFNSDKNKNRGKKHLFESWGYDIIDSQWLQEEFCRQAREKYEAGDFQLDFLNNYGQRINIEIVLPRKDKIGTVKFLSGWLVYPNGVIRLTTPFAAKE